MRDRIVTWADKFGGRSLSAHAAMSPSFTGDLTPPADGIALESVAVARVNHGRWIADCPSDGCGGAEYVNVDELLFFCCECRNGAWGNHPLRVELPTPDLRATIERYLVARPLAVTRRWRPGETIEQLRDENRAHGVRLRERS